VSIGSSGQWEGIGGGRACGGGQRMTCKRIIATGQEAVAQGNRFLTRKRKLETLNKWQEAARTRKWVSQRWQCGSVVGNEVDVVGL
jgi:hypothetical protein